MEVQESQKETEQAGHRVKKDHWVWVDEPKKTNVQQCQMEDHLMEVQILKQELGSLAFHKRQKELTRQGIQCAHQCKEMNESRCGWEDAWDQQGSKFKTQMKPHPWTQTPKKGSGG